MKDDNTLICWGNNVSKQTVVPEGQFVQVSAGTDHTCAVTIDNTVTCWGSGYHGQATPPEGESFNYVGAGSYFSCGIKTDGSTVCWGHDAYGQVSGAPFGISTQLSAGNHSNVCRIKNDGVINCWGWNVTAPQGNFDHVSKGYDHGCGIKTNGKVLCWGKEEFGRTIPPENLAGIEYLYGCTNSNALNYNPDATVSDGSCKFDGDNCGADDLDVEVLGCTYSKATNYSSTATVDDGSCKFVTSDGDTQCDQTDLDAAYNNGYTKGKTDGSSSCGTGNYPSPTYRFDSTKNTGVLNLPTVDIQLLNPLFPGSWSTQNDAFSAVLELMPGTAGYFHITDAVAKQPTE
ncbi:MAG TPA: hypothetical protein ENK59_05680 [Thioploca sp.]|nr:hypothetical protein [Thioploca sp.]